MAKIVLRSCLFRCRFNKILSYPSELFFLVLEPSPWYDVMRFVCIVFSLSMRQPTSLTRIVSGVTILRFSFHGLLGM